ncbi:MAG: type IX secretion system membrane protein PorP/SprF [Bacteroidetes bacterium]|nr:type IX secretion system membrane protein PorP/SprF [Bacteroidota bacterium]
MTRRILIGICLITALSVSAQNSLIPSVSNYHLAWTTYNPAFSGLRDAISLSSIYRSRLYGGVGPQDMQLNVHTPLANPKLAVGAVVAHNSTPPDQGMYNLMTTYAYRIHLKKGRLAFGLSAGMYGVTSNTSGTLIRDPNDPQFPMDDAYSRWFPNFGAGVLYFTDNYFLGVSVPELLAIPGPNQKLTANSEDYRVIVTGAYLWDISTAFRMKPSFIVDYSRAITSFKTSMNIGLMDSRVFIGGAYDHPNYGIALVNIQVNPQWLVGYAYTIGLKGVRKYLGGAHEVVLRWELRPVIKTIPDDPFYF